MKFLKNFYNLEIIGKIMGHLIWTGLGIVIAIVATYILIEKKEISHQ